MKGRRASEEDEEDEVCAEVNTSVLLPPQMTEQRKQKQRIGLLGHPQHMNVNPQQPA